MKNLFYLASACASACIVGFVIGAVLGLLLRKEIPRAVVGSAGDTNSTQRIAQVSLDLGTTTPTTATTTAVCLLKNTDATDRIITSIDIYAAGLSTIFGASNPAGIASWYWKVATSTGVYDAPVGSQILSSTIATSSPNFFVSSTSPGVSGTSTTGAYSRVWTAGTCLNLLLNATSSASTGTMKVGYMVAP